VCGIGRLIENSIAVSGDRSTKLKSKLTAIIQNWTERGSQVRSAAGGALSGSAERHPIAGPAPEPIGSALRYKADVERARRLLPLVEEGFAATLTEAATRFALSHPGVGTILVGMATPEQFEAALAPPKKVRYRKPRWTGWRNCGGGCGGSAIIAWWRALAARSAVGKRIVWIKFVGWAKARFRAVPTIWFCATGMVGTLRFAHPTSSCQAAALPERFDLVIGGERTAPGGVDGGPFLFAQATNASAPGLDLARQLGKFLLVLDRPGRHQLANGFHRWAHGSNIGQRRCEFHYAEFVGWAKARLRAVPTIYR
jgi:hypothetical protein